MNYTVNLISEKYPSTKNEISPFKTIVTKPFVEKYPNLYAKLLENSPNDIFIS